MHTQHEGTVIRTRHEGRDIISRGDTDVILLSSEASQEDSPDDNQQVGMF